jgi:hypothetical protein
MVMNKQILFPATVSVADRKNEEPRKPDYAAPRMFAVGSTVELIQGAGSRGPQDWYGSWYVYP